MQPKLDDAEDIIDEGCAFVEERDLKQITEEKATSESAIKSEDKRRGDMRYQRCFAEITIDERLARNLCTKVNQIVTENDLSVENFVLIKTYLEDSMKSWKICEDCGKILFLW